MNENAAWPAVGLPMNLVGGAANDAGTLHVRCGEDIHRALTEAGFAGRFLEFSDPYCQGPVRRLPREAFIAERADFIASAYLENNAGTHDKLAAQYDGLDRAAHFDRVVLWFEHDTYDQLILSAVLATLSRYRDAVAIELICVDAVPGVDHFIGLGQLMPDQLLRLWHDSRRPVTGDDFEQAACTWDALRSDDPADLAALARHERSAIPIMTRALRRHLQELPGTADGLGLTQRLTLEIIDAAGSIPAGAAYRELMTAREPLPYLGDLMFWYVLRDLAATSEPVLIFESDSRDQSWPRKKLSITESGRCILRGEVDYLDLYQGTRWIGAVPARRGEPVPRWDRGNDRLA